ncbi:MAG: helicase-related protein [bacterium]
MYKLKESEADRKIATQIRKLAGELRAVTHFTNDLVLPAAYRKRGQTAESYLRMRLHNARSIARYQIMALLRSSSVALAEHIVGTGQAVKDFGLVGFKKSTQTGNALKRLQDLRGKPPKSKLDTELPEWLRDPTAHAAACDHDHAIYSQIYQCVRSLSDAREEAKVEKLLTLAGKHSLVLAFDRSPITLHAIQQRIGKQRPGQPTIVATGDPSSDRERMLTEFKPGSGAHHLIGLCSDSLSEGVNLQQASCMVHLDMPSVVRIAEQRAG